MMVGTVRTFTPTPGTVNRDVLDAAGPVRVLRRLSQSEADEEVGPMFEVESLSTGKRVDAFLDELSMRTSNAD